VAHLVHTLYRNARVLAGVFFAGTLLSGCALIVPQTDALNKAWPDDLPVKVELTEVPFFPQEDYQCGPAALATSLAHFKVPVKPEDLIDKVYLPARQGSLQVEMLAGARGYGMVSYQLKPDLETVLREVAAGNPVIVLQDYGSWPIRIWHYAVVAGYDRSRGELVLRSGTKQRLAIPFGVFEYTWVISDHWAMVTTPPERVPATAVETDYLNAIVAMERVAQPAATRRAYSAFLGRWPDNLTANVGLANSQYAAGELADAAAVLRRAAAQNPGSPIVLNNLAQALSDLGRGDEALGVIDQAAAVHGNGPFAAAINDTRSVILQKLGKRP
jgi:hypothetical protein